MPIIVVESMSSAIPPATFPIILAVAGTTTIKSALLARGKYALYPNIEVHQTSLLSRRIIRYRSECKRIQQIQQHSFVIITFTSKPSFFNLLTTSTALYAAIPPQTPTTAVFPLSTVSAPPRNKTYYYNYFIPLFGLMYVIFPSSISLIATETALSDSHSVSFGAPSVSCLALLQPLPPMYICCPLFQAMNLLADQSLSCFFHNAPHISFPSY